MEGRTANTKYGTAQMFIAPASVGYLRKHLIYLLVIEADLQPAWPLSVPRPTQYSAQRRQRGFSSALSVCRHMAGPKSIRI